MEHSKQNRQLVKSGKPTSVFAIEQFVDAKPDADLEQSNMQRFVFQIHDKKNNKHGRANLPAWQVDRLLELSRAAMLDQMESGSLYATDPKYFSTRDEKDGFNFCYELSIMYNTNMDYPICVQIVNYWAPLIKGSNGQKNVARKENRNEETTKFFLSREEWFDMINYCVQVWHDYMTKSFSARYQKSLEATYEK